MERLHQRLMEVMLTIHIREFQVVRTFFENLPVCVKSQRRGYIIKQSRTHQPPCSFQQQQSLYIIQKKREKEKNTQRITCLEIHQKFCWEPSQIYLRQPLSFKKDQGFTNDQRQPHLFCTFLDCFPYCSWSLKTLSTTAQSHNQTVILQSSTVSSKGI